MVASRFADHEAVGFVYCIDGLGSKDVEASGHEWRVGWCWNDDLKEELAGVVVVAFSFCDGHRGTADSQHRFLAVECGDRFGDRRECVGA